MASRKSFALRNIAVYVVNILKSTKFSKPSNALNLYAFYRTRLSDSDLITPYHMDHIVCLIRIR